MNMYKVRYSDLYIYKYINLNLDIYIFIVVGVVEQADVDLRNHWKSLGTPQIERRR